MKFKAGLGYVLGGPETMNSGFPRTIIKLWKEISFLAYGEPSEA
jgi:hypothetical protein